MKDISLIAFKNLKAYKGFYIKFTALLVCLMFLFSLFSLYSMSLIEAQDEMKNNSLSANYFITETEIDSSILTGKYEIIEHKQYDFTSQTNIFFGTEFDILPMALVKIKIDEKEYSSDIYSNINISCSENNNIFSKNDKIEYERRGYIDSIFHGELPTAENEIILSERLINYYGITDVIIGKVLSLQSRVNNSPILLNAKVVGVISDGYYNLSGHMMPNSFVPMIMTSNSNQLFTDENNVKSFFRYSFDEWVSNDTIKLFNDTHAYYAGGHVISEIKSIASMQEVTVKMFVILGCTLAIGLVLVIYLMMIKYIEIFSKNCGILLSLGMSWCKLKSLLFLQLLIVNIIAFPIALIATIGLFFAINAIMSQVYFVALSLSLKLLLALFSTGIGIVLTLTSGLYLYTVCKIRKKNIRSFINN